MFKLPKMTGEEFTVFAMVQDAADGSKDYPARTLAGYIQRVEAALAAENSRLSESTVSPEYPLYPSLSEAGKNAAEAIIEVFRGKLSKAAEEAIAGLYYDLPSFIESDSWTNFRNHLVAGLKNYSNRKIQGEYDFAKIRAAIYEQFREEITADIQADIIKEFQSTRPRGARLYHFLIIDIIKIKVLITPISHICMLF